MKVQPSDIGLIGLAVMGENLALNMANHGFKVSVYNRTAERTRTLANGRAKGTTIQPTYDLKEFVASLAKPRRIFLMVQAGAPVDSVLAQLRPLLEAGDIVMDGGTRIIRIPSDGPRRWRRQVSTTLAWG